MLTQIINGHILTPQGWMKDGSVLISDGKILEVTNSDLAVIGATVIDAKGMYIVPGFVHMEVADTTSQKELSKLFRRPHRLI